MASVRLVAPAARLETGDGNERGNYRRGLGRGREQRRLSNVVAACVLLLLVYSVIALVKDPRGPLAPDSGGKLATLQTATSPIDVDVGYWAADLDRDGSAHPLQYTREFEHGWAQLSTLPMFVAAQPLVSWAGLRGALVLPMLAGVACALAAAALARRFGGSGRAAFWTVGLGTPVAVYALDFWEHVPGLALMMWGVVLAVDCLDRADLRLRAVAAGALFGAAAALRTEAFVYALVLFGILLFFRRATTRGHRCVQALAFLLGFASLAVANTLLERIVLGADLRGGRTLEAATSVGRSLATRVEDALTGLIGVSGGVESTEWIFGAVFAVLIGFATVCLVSKDRSRRRLGLALVVFVGVLFGARMVRSFGFVPGMLAASPFAIAGLVLGVRNVRTRPLLVLAMVPLPLVWWFQPGGVAPQWGSRYQLLSSVLLAVLFSCSPLRTPLATRALFVLALLVTGAGVGVAVDRAEQIDHGMEALLARHDDAVVSFQANLLREGGAFYTPRRHWLNGDRADPSAAMSILEEAGDRRVAVVARTDDQLPKRFGAYERVGSERLSIRPGEELRVSRYVLMP